MAIAAELFSSLVLLMAGQPAPAPGTIVQQPVDTMVRVGGHELHFVLYRVRCR